MRNVGMLERWRTKFAKCRRTVTNQVGMSMMEVMIAMVILTIALLGLLGMGMVALEGNDWADNSTKTTHLMLKKIEELRASGDLTSGSEVVDKIKLTWKVSSADKFLREVTVVATWVDQRDRTSTNTLVTLVKSDVE